MENTAGTGVHTFTLHDARGKAHSYLVYEHPPDEGMPILYELLALGAPSLMALASAALKVGDLATLLAALRPAGPEDADGEVSSGADDAKELRALLDGLDLPALGHEIQRALSMGRAPQLTRKILSKALRDGQRLSGDGEFNVAFQANYVEMLRAVWEICQINRFFPQLSMSESSPTEASRSLGAPRTLPPAA